MPTKTISYKNVNLKLSNQVELFVTCEMWDGSKQLDDACIVVNVLGKTNAQIKDEIKAMLKAAAANALMQIKPVPDIPTDIPNFTLRVEYLND